MWLQLCINLTLGLFKAKRKKWRPVDRSSYSDSDSSFSPTVFACAKGLHPHCAEQLHFLGWRPFYDNEPHRPLNRLHINIAFQITLIYYYYYYYYYYYWYSAPGPVWAETRAQSGDWYGSGTLHPGQVLRGSLPLLSPVFRRSHFSPPAASTSVTTREILAAEGGIRRFRPGLNPRTWVLKASTLPLDHRSHHADLYYVFESKKVFIFPTVLTSLLKLEQRVTIAWSSNKHSRAVMGKQCCFPEGKNALCKYC